MNSAVVVAGDAALASHYNNLRKDLIVNGGEYAVTTGSANAYVLAIDAQFVAYTAGDTFKFKTNFGNTGSCSLNVNAVGAKTLKDLEGNTFGSGAIPSGSVVVCIYNGTDLIVIGGALATTSNKGVVEMATDAEALAQTDQTRFVNPKQVAIVKNGTYGTLTVSIVSGPTDTASASVQITKATIMTLTMNTGFFGESRLETSPDDAAWSTLYTISASSARDTVILAKEGLYYRVRGITSATGGGVSASATITYHT